MIIGICGKAGSGKSTASDFLVKDHGFICVPFADPLKRIAKDVFSFTNEQLWGPSEERNKPDMRYQREHYGKVVTCECCGLDCEVDADKPCYLTPRHALQQLGSEWGRACYPNVWVEYALRVANSLLYGSGIARSVHYSYNAQEGLFATNVPAGPPPKGVVIPDVRFRNEVDAITAAGGEVWRIRRRQEGLASSAGQHQSETEQNGIPWELFSTTLFNTGTIENLQSTVSTALGAARQK